MIRIIIISAFLNIVTNGLTQTITLTNQWQNIGPVKLPSPNSNSSSKGIGPVEFIRTTTLQKDLLLAGSLTGGLFYSTNGGEQWINAGSDYWKYSSTGWADFYPENKNIWFATSHERESNGKPGRLGKYGGVFRTTNSGTNWEQIANIKDFSGRENITIFKTMFHPKKPKMLYVLTSDNLYYTNNCTAKNVEWHTFTAAKGYIYDMCSVDNSIFLSWQQFGKWHLAEIGNNEIKKNEDIEKISASLARITLAKSNHNLLVLLDFKKGADKLWSYNPVTLLKKEISRSQRVTFGHGRTFNVSPTNQNDVYIGVGTRVRRFNLISNKFENLGSDYHVDIEFVEIDPFDENKIYLATHGGVYISKDKGKTWDSKSIGLGIAEVLGLAVGVTDPYQIAIGTFHDGSMVYADWDNNGQYRWENVNGGDALIPLINPENGAEVYTSNQYTGGGLYYSNDTSKTKNNIHSYNGLPSSGWQMAACLHPIQSNILFFNFYNKKTKNINIARTNDASQRKNADIISDFETTHNLKKFKVYSLFTSKYHPNVLIAYVLNYTTNEKGKPITEHKVFRTKIALDSAKKVIDSWFELENPRNDWIGDIKLDRKKMNKMYYSYIGGKKMSNEYPNETGMIMYSKYRKKNGRMKRISDISNGISLERGGRYNLVYVSNDSKYMFIGTRSGVYYGTKSTLKGLTKWKKVGYGLPHVMVYGLAYDPTENILTVGLRGRGVWRISLNSSQKK